MNRYQSTSWQAWVAACALFVTIIACALIMVARGASAEPGYVPVPVTVPQPSATASPVNGSPAVTG